MSAHIRRQALRWALVWALALAVVGMHHLSTQPAVHEAVVAECCDHGVSGEHAPQQDGQHDMLHLCLAILSAALGLALILFALHAMVAARLPAPAVARPTEPRAPPPRPPTLASLCVLRL